jgi:hypothetical protein
MHREHRLVGIFALTILALCVAGVAQAQRITPCNAATPNNAVCVTGVAPDTFVDGTPIVVALTYRVEQRTGTSGSFATVASGLTTPQAYIQNLAPGSYQFRMFANCTICTSESAASNIAGATATPIPKVPQPPVITIAVVISPDINVAPVIRIVDPSGDPQPGSVVGFVPVGRECSGKVVFRYRGDSYRRVAVRQEELWNTTNARNVAAPCA